MLTTSVRHLGSLMGEDAASRAAKPLVRTRLVPRVGLRVNPGEVQGEAPGLHLKPLPSLLAG